jgi:hypothetical protein
MGTRNALSPFKSRALPEGTRRLGRPAVTWLDSVLEDMKELETKVTGSGNHKRGEGSSGTVAPAEEVNIL